MSLFKLLLRMFNLLRNSRHSSCYHICRAWGVHFIWFIRLDNVQWFSLGKSKHSDIADISWYISYIYIYQICCWYRAAVWVHQPAPLVLCPWWPAEQRDVVWQHQDTLGALDGSHGCRWPPGPCHSAVPGHREGTEGLKLLKCCDGGCCSSCAARCLGSLCVQTS